MACSSVEEGTDVVELSGPGQIGRLGSAMPLNRPFVCKVLPSAGCALRADHRPGG